MLRFFPQKNKYVEEASQYAFDKEGQIPQHCHYYGRKWPVGTESKTAENCWT